MTYQAALDYLFERLPMYQRLGPAAYKPDLSNILALAELTGWPHKRLKCVHVAGTNGKGSVSHMLASVLQEAGYKTGLTTSPHLKDFRERIRINGLMIPHEAVILFLDTYMDSWSHLQPSFFEIAIAMAFWHFDHEQTDLCVIETGLGGRLDSTNIIEPIVAIITNVSLDHTFLLGDTVEKIASEKAGIVKPGRPLVLGTLSPEAFAVVNQRAQQLHSPIYLSTELTKPLTQTDLEGEFQVENQKTALCAIVQLRKEGYRISEDAIVAGMAKVKENTGLRGRWQVLRERPYIVADVGHNEAGIAAAMRQMMLYKFDRLHVVLGMVADKDINGVMSKLPSEATYYFCKANIPRGLDSDLLRLRAGTFGLRGESYTSVAKAYEAARIYASTSDAIFIGGSFFTVAEII